MASELLLTIWQGDQMAIPVTTTLANLNTILWADYTPAMPCSVMYEYAKCCQTLICNNYAKSVVTAKHYTLSTVGSTSFSMKN